MNRNAIRHCVGVCALGILSLWGTMRIEAATDIYVGTSGGTLYDYNGSLSGTNGIVSGLVNVEAVAVGPTGNVYVSDDVAPSGGGTGMVAYYDPHLTTSGGDTTTAFTGIGATGLKALLTINPSNGDVYVGRSYSVNGAGYASVTQLPASLASITNSNQGYNTPIVSIQESPLSTSSPSFLGLGTNFNSGGYSVWGIFTNDQSGFSYSYYPAPTGGMVFGPDGTFFFNINGNVNHNSTDGVSFINYGAGSGNVGGNPAIGPGQLATGPFGTIPSDLTSFALYVGKDDGTLVAYNPDPAVSANPNYGVLGSLTAAQLGGAITYIATDQTTGNVLVAISSGSNAQVLEYNYNLSSLLYSSPVLVGTTINTMAAVPEPSTFVLAALIGVCLLPWVRRNARSQHARHVFQLA